MTHSFLLEPGRWLLNGNWMEKNGTIMPVQGKILITWKDDWFTMATKLLFPESDRPEITITHKGRLNCEDRMFSFVVQHSAMGKIEGEGWVMPQAIIQRYWVMDDKQVRTGFQTIYRQDDRHYHMCGGVNSGRSLINSMDALLTLQ